MATLIHTPFRETDGASLARMLAEHDPIAIRKALNRLEAYGALASRWHRGLCLYRLNREYPAYAELRDLLLAMGRVWIEFRESGEYEADSYKGSRAARDRGREVVPL